MYAGAVPAVPILRFAFVNGEKEGGWREGRLFRYNQKTSWTGTLTSRKERRVLELSVTQIRGVTKWYSAVYFDRRRVSLTSRAVRSEAAKQLPGLEIASIVPDTHSLRTISMRPVGCELGVALRLSSLSIRLTIRQTWRKCAMPLRVGAACNYQKPHQPALLRRIFRAAWAEKLREEFRCRIY